jgi:hypothetical protein
MLLLLPSLACEAAGGVAFVPSTLIVNRELMTACGSGCKYLGLSHRHTNLPLVQDKLFSQPPERGCWSALYAATHPPLTGKHMHVPVVQEGQHSAPDLVLGCMQSSSPGWRDQDSKPLGLSHCLLPGKQQRPGRLCAGEGGSYYGPLYFMPQPLNLVNCAKLSPHCAAAKDPAATARLYDETVAEVERVLGSPLPSVLPRQGST